MASGVEVMTTITVSDEQLIAAAEALARSENTTLDELVRVLLEKHVQKNERLRAFDETTGALRGKLVVGRKLSRDEMNAR